MDQQRHKRIIISGGGTGGHIFPAISIANALRKKDPGIDILFVGAEGRMEMEKVPDAGYKIRGLPVAGFYRSFTLRNITVLFRLIRSLSAARKILKEFRPDAAVGVGGYASGPILRQAGKMGIPTLIQEQNSYAGITNRLLAKRASVICVAYEGMEKYFPAEKIKITGNPVRHTYDNTDNLKDEALAYFGLKSGKPVILVLGGSLGAGTINNSLSMNLDKVTGSDIQWIWQTGKHYYESVSKAISGLSTDNISVHGFIDRMDYAFAAADIIVSRAGAGTISELCLAGKPVILVPSPNVAEDHQTRNARALSDREAAILVEDRKALEILADVAIGLVTDNSRRTMLSENIKKMALRDADIKIAEEVLKLTEK
ncbi:MAG TPA: undecaprenyldiphospho-muramoylpentapeptide beta-N-acetylglucosaminyltransferase [Bacteroidales bacterium]|jgi:UDP-N-acetylglucosamine--N-acetylmuramyl-(pentapeptide) pyrophosphoryl-undecaprenol N-acetylglucosamine transferase|nr:undecaprenyldiphospho-muramoylpentapeptide beta-N-acetylglucosaminyltransferase [Bacteroidales bacterium]HOX73159.1 undecaprenyldiphospho-muramoylpentapeptide beta-N-acetylglucosaminyltransferase [Bacteroidales bacterium]HQM68406.1 undecaprenyldiphospho-muramoylpentapeptide beta-N-acetylglucosaminyltransferase [Bacteroidales bacterium]